MMASRGDEPEGLLGEGLRVLVTGANGFVGSAIADYCLRAGMRVTTTARSSHNSERLPGFFIADITKPGSLTPAMKGVDAVVHAAGLAHQFYGSASNPTFRDVNVKGTEHVARSAAQAGVSHLLLISSVAVYGSHIETESDESAEADPRGPYAESKHESELRAMEVARSGTDCLTILRLATVYGEGDPGNVSRLMRALDRGRFIWIGRGENRKSLIHRDDVARACVSVLQSSCAGLSVYNVSGPAHSMREIVEGLSRQLRRPAPRWHVPRSVALTAAGILDRCGGSLPRLGEAGRTIKKWLANDVYDSRKFEERFDFQPQVVLEEGLRREVTWHRTSRPITKSKQRELKR